jgi:hypothetical protein
LKIELVINDLLLSSPIVVDSVLTLVFA